jgi:hypothetical protein
MTMEDRTSYKGKLTHELLKENPDLYSDMYRHMVRSLPDRNWYDFGGPVNGIKSMEKA